MGDHRIHERAASGVPSELILWRRRMLLNAGFNRRPASDLAAEESVDFHELLDLIDRGCPPHLAARIVAPLDTETESG
jgi:hypothetical protein